MKLKITDMEEKIKKKEILKEIEQASNEKYVTEWNSEGRIGRQKKVSNIKRGAIGRAAGGAFELKVRKDLEEKDFIVDKWSNNIDLVEGRIIPCRRVFKRFGKGKVVMTIGTGFPDFVCFKKKEDLFDVIGIEVKMNGCLSREEKLKCSWLLKENIFSKILIASKIKEKGKIRIIYLDFLEIAKRMRA